MKLSNKTILITGASSGIGRAAALRFAVDKCHLILAARNESDLNEVKKLVEEKGSTAEIIICDVSKVEDIKAMFRKIQKLDAVFNNAGLGFVKDIHELQDSEIQSMVDVNVKGMILVTKYAAELMVRQKYGHIIMTSSLAGLAAFPEWSVYCATKWAITGFTDAVREELHKYHVKVSSLHPGVIKTDFWRRGNIEYSEATATSSEVVANSVYRALFTNKHKIYIPFYVSVIYFLYETFPWLAELFLNNIG